MRIHELRPAMGGQYRHRKAGFIATLRRYAVERDNQYRRLRSKYGGEVHLVGDSGWTWDGSCHDFWQEWIHADVHDDSLN